MIEPNKDGDNKAPSNAERFVEDLIKKIKPDHALRARFRKALSQSQAPAVWGDLVPYVDITKTHARTAFTLIGASIALEDPSCDGSFDLGRALRESSLKNGPKIGEDSKKSDPEQARLRRLLTCRSCEEVCIVLRPILALIRSRKPGALKYSELLKDLLAFDFAEERIKAKWISNFYRSSSEDKS